MFVAWLLLLACEEPAPRRVKNLAPDPGFVKVDEVDRRTLVPTQAPGEVGVGAAWGWDRDAVASPEGAAGEAAATPPAPGEGTLTLTLALGGARLVCSAPLQLAALRVSDRATLSYPAGVLRFDPGRLSCPDAPERVPNVFSAVFADADGNAAQLFIDIGSFGGIPADAPDPVETPMVGTVQLHDRVADLDALVRVGREGGLRLTTTTPASVSAARLLQGERGGRAGVLFGQRMAERPPKALTVSMALDVSVPESVAERLPSFLRTAVTVATFDEVRQEVAELVDPYEARVESLRRGGASEDQIQAFTREQFELLRQLRDAEAGRGPSLEELAQPR